MKIKILNLTLAIFVATTALVGCRRNIEAPQTNGQLNPASPTLSKAVAEVKKDFDEQKLDGKLLERFKDTTDVYWRPRWQAAYIKPLNDSVEYAYVPLVPIAKSKKSGKLYKRLSLTATERFLIAERKKGKSDFRVGVYLFDALPGSHKDPLKQTNPYAHFSGKLLLRGLTTDIRGRFIYKDGKLLNRQSPSTSVAKAGTSTAKAAYCIDYWTCTWESTDGTHSQYCTTSGANDCEVPGYFSNYGGWMQIQTTIEPSCYDDGNIPFPGMGGTGDPVIGSAPSSSGGSGGAGDTTPLESEVLQNEVALYPPCPGLTDAWTPLITFKPTNAVAARLTSLTQQQLAVAKLMVPYSSVDPLWQIQAIGDAQGLAVNLDMFSVTMDKLPVINGVQMTSNSFLEYIRNNINDFTGSGMPTFSPQTAIPGEDTRWTNHEIGAIVSINIPLDNGSVILSDYSDNPYDTHWTFSTLHDPYNGAHPVSGTRTFGITHQESYTFRDFFGGINYIPESFTFYIQGADRINSRIGEMVGSAKNFSSDPKLAFQFQKADDSWKALIQNISNFASARGSSTAIFDPVTVRPKWTDVLNALNNHRPLNSVPCY